MPETPRQSTSPRESIFRQLAPYAALGWQLAITVCVPGALGWWIDSRAETSPAWMLVGLMLGATIGLIQFFRSITQLARRPPEE